MKLVRWETYGKEMCCTNTNIRNMISASLYNRIFNHVFFLSINIVHVSRDIIYREVGITRRIYK